MRPAMKIVRDAVKGRRKFKWAAPNRVEFEVDTLGFRYQVSVVTDDRTVICTCAPRAPLPEKYRPLLELWHECSDWQIAQLTRQRMAVRFRDADGERLECSMAVQSDDLSRRNVEFLIATCLQVADGMNVKMGMPTETEPSGLSISFVQSLRRLRLRRSA
jgi:hypothetical protein